jgi:hypothetical protein
MSEGLCRRVYRFSAPTPSPGLTPILKLVPSILIIYQYATYKVRTQLAGCDSESKLKTRAHAHAAAAQATGGPALAAGSQQRCKVTFLQVDLTSQQHFLSQDYQKDTGSTA